MSVHDLRIQVAGNTLYGPELVDSTPKVFTITNMGTEDLEDLGIWIVPATSVGDVDDPADYPPHSDYEDILQWGTDAELNTVPGGLVMTIPQNVGPDLTVRVTRNFGSSRGNKIPVQDLNAGDSINIEIEFEVPALVPARRFFIDVKVE